MKESPELRRSRFLAGAAVTAMLVVAAVVEEEMAAVSRTPAPKRTTP